MTESDEKVLTQLKSRLPSERSEAALILASSAGAHHVVALTQALESESVPNVRSLLATALKRAQASIKTPAETEPAETEAERLLNQTPGIILHELMGTIGSMRYFAEDELGEDYEFSMTRRSTENMRQRIHGLTSLLQLNVPPRAEEIVLGEFVRENVPAGHEQSFEYAGDLAQSQIVTTDSGLMAIILRNVYQNAIEARTGERKIVLDWDVTDSSFWITVENSFERSQLSLASSRAEGVSSKKGHRGIGLKLVETAASRLGYEIDLTGTAGVAVFSLRGNKNFG